MVVVTYEADGLVVVFMELLLEINGSCEFLASLPCNRHGWKNSPTSMLCALRRLCLHIIHDGLTCYTSAHAES